MKRDQVKTHPTLTAWYYYLMFPLVVMIGFVVGFILKLQWANIWITYGLIPMMDKIWRMDWVNPNQADVERLQRDWRFKMCLYFVIFLDWNIFFMGMDTLHFITIWNIIPRLFLAANMCTSGFLVAHELFHKPSFVDKTIGTLHQMKNLYMHFTVEHLFGHHKRVATPDDPASAPKGMTIYQFIPRSVIGGFKSAYKINPAFTSISVVGSVLFLGILYRFYGWAGVAYHLVVAFGSIFYLEITNYIEHYGLRRKKLADGSYEKVTIRHSWNAAHRMSNYLLFKLQRHSDHHQNSLKPYQVLCANEDSPQLPHGYLVCFNLALFPRVWFSIMDPLVDEYNKLSDKGTELQTLKIAEKKVDRFVEQSFWVTFSMMVVEIVIDKIIY